MKATGIVRRIDDLGRVVIPKEIRRTLRIREGDPLEIFVDRDGEVILKKSIPRLVNWVLLQRSMQILFMKRSDILLVSRIETKLLLYPVPRKRSF